MMALLNHPGWLIGGGFIVVLIGVLCMGVGIAIKALLSI